MKHGHRRKRYSCCTGDAGWVFLNVASPLVLLGKRFSTGAPVLRSSGRLGPLDNGGHSFPRLPVGSPCILP